jgi:acyl-CoA thioester hydrolase
MELNVRIDWSEVDLFGHVNNVMYAKYMQAARVHFMEELGIMKTYHEQKIGFMVAATSVIYLKPLFYPGSIKVKTLVKEIKNTSFILTHEIINQNDELAAKGEDVIVYFDFNKHEKMALNAALIKLLESRTKSD